MHKSTKNDNINIMKRKNRKSIIYIFIFIVLAISLIWIFHYYNGLIHQVDEFNQTERIINGTFIDEEIYDDTIDETGSEVSLSVKFRGGSTDIWTKKNKLMKYSFATLTGCIYDMSVTNNSEYTVSEWYIRQNIHQDCYINNAWCGKVEIHQFDKDGNENIQLVDFADSSSLQDITLDYEMFDADQLIKLTEGDYIIYYPSENVHETPINAESLGSNVITSGIIYYTWIGGIQNLPPLDLSDITLHFYYEMASDQGQAFSTLITLLSLWFFVLILFLFIFITSLIDQKRISKREALLNEILTVFTHFIDAKDPYTKGHSTRVAEYSEQIAKAMNMSAYESRNVYYIALIHDIGKCYIDDTILKKPGKLSHDEFEIIKSHTTLGAKMLENFKSMPGIHDGVLYHHERYDGTGYPTGKSGENIPLIARIICVADSFDAMNSNRCYRPRLTREIIIDEIKNNAGSQFDPHIAKVFLKLIESGDISID